MYGQAESESFKGKKALAGIYRALLLGVLLTGMRFFADLPLSTAEYCVVMVIYLVLLRLLHGIYGACSAGRFRVPELILSQTLSNVFSLSALYVGLALYCNKFWSIVLVLVVCVIQEIIGVLWSLLANALYYKHYTAPRTVIVYGDETVLNLLYNTPFFLKKYDVCRTVYDPWDEMEDLEPQISDCEVIFAIDVSAKLANGIAKYCVESNKKGFFLPRIGHIVLSGAEYVSSFSMPMLMVHRAGGKGTYQFIKRMFDVVASLAGIVLTFPIMIVTAAAIKLEDHGPVFYRQVRLTQNGREFSILKFRSMTVNAEKDGVARLAGENDSRITKVGRMIRACRIDELPQLFNILMGDMSIVGPRPERPEIAQQYEESLPEFRLRLQVKAGLTGLAQVYGRYNTDPYSKLQMDLMYINEMSLWNDLNLIVATVKILFVRESTQGIDQNQLTALPDVHLCESVKSV